MRNSLIYKITGSLGIFGCMAVVAADIIGIAVHEKHDPISDTISMLAIGKYGWIQDWGLILLSIGYLTLAVGLFTWKKKGWRWNLSLIIMALMSVDIFLIAEHNQYAGRPGENIHRSLVYSLAGLFLVLNFLIRKQLKSLKPILDKFSLITGILWLVLAPLLPLIPDKIDGAYERFICTVLVVWPVVIAYYLIKISEEKVSRRQLASREF